jgi:hypothetical protein
MLLRNTGALCSDASVDNVRLQCFTAVKDNYSAALLRCIAKYAAHAKATVLQANTLVLPLMV